MSKLKIILIILGIAVLITTLSLFFKGDGVLLGGVSGSKIVRGFPGHFLESYQSEKYPAKSVIKKFLLINFLSDILLYTIVVLSLFYLIESGRKNKKWWLLILSFVLAVAWLIIDITRTSQCVGGSPVAFRNICGGESNIKNGFILFGVIFDILFWFCLSSIFVAVLDLLNSKKIGKWKYLIIPAFISLMSFWYNTPCEGMFCILAGRGFPLPFYINNEFIWVMLGTDYLIWALILYPFCRLLFRVIKKLFSKYKYN